MTTNVSKLVRTSLRKVGAIPANTSLKAQELADGREELRRMLDSWRLESLMIYVIALRQFALAPGRTAYTYGDGGHFDAPRPVVIETATIINSAGGRQPLELMSADEYTRVSYRGEVGAPSRFYYQPTFPLGEVRFDRVPDDPTVELGVREELVDLPISNTTDFDLPPGYEDAILFNLGVRLAGEYDVVPGNEVLGLAASFKALIKRGNHTVPQLLIDYASVGAYGTYDINAGPVR